MYYTGRFFIAELLAVGCSVLSYAHSCVKKCRNCRYNVTLGRVRVAVFAVESNKYYMF